MSQRGYWIDIWMIRCIPNDSARLVYAHIALRQKLKAGVCNESTGTIAQHLGFGKGHSRVVKAIRCLREIGLLQVDHPSKGHVPGAYRVYKPGDRGFPFRDIYEEIYNPTESIRSTKSTRPNQSSNPTESIENKQVKATPDQKQIKDPDPEGCKFLDPEVVSEPQLTTAQTATPPVKKRKAAASGTYIPPAFPKGATMAEIFELDAANHRQWLEQQPTGVIERYQTEKGERGRE